MKLAGLQKLSLIDFPGLICAIVFTQGCDFACPYCQNPDLVPLSQKGGYPEGEVLRYLLQRKNIIEGLVITGGEPLLQKDIASFIEKARSAGIKIKLDTNGSNPELLEKLIMGRKVDYIALDVKTSLAKYGSVLRSQEGLLALRSRIEESIRLVMLADVPYEFRTTCVPGIVDETDFRDIAGMLKGAKRYFLQQFRPEVTLDRQYRTVKPYTKQTLEKFKEILSESIQQVEIRGI